MFTWPASDRPGIFDQKGRFKVRGAQHSYGMHSADPICLEAFAIPLKTHCFPPLPAVGRLVRRGVMVGVSSHLLYALAQRREGFVSDDLR